MENARGVDEKFRLSIKLSAGIPDSRGMDSRMSRNDSGGGGLLYVAIKQLRVLYKTTPLAITHNRTGVMNPYPGAVVFGCWNLFTRVH